MARAKTKQIPGFRIQPKLPVSIGWFGAVCTSADFTTYGSGRWPCVEAVVRMGMVPEPYTLFLTHEQALEADLIEKER